MRAGLIYAAITVAAIVWFVLDRWEGSRAVAASLILGGALALALHAASRAKRFRWAPPLLVFSTVAHGAHRLYVRLAEVEEASSTLGGSGTDLIVLLLIPAWLVAFAFTIAAILTDASAASPRAGTPRGGRT